MPDDPNATPPPAAPAEGSDAQDSIQEVERRMEQVHTARAEQKKLLRDMLAQQEALEEQDNQLAERAKRIEEQTKKLEEAQTLSAEREKELEAQAKKVAEGVSNEDGAHQGTGLNPHAYSIHAILERFRPPISAEGEGEYDAGGEASDEESKPRNLTPMQEAAQAIDALYASDETAPAHWQDKTQLKKELRREVRRLLMPLGLEGWKKAIPLEVEHYAVLHYAKP